jgi:DNA/RNA endonuclease G (NUC1)
MLRFVRLASAAFAGVVASAVACADLRPTTPSFAGIRALEAPEIAGLELPPVYISEFHYDNDGTDSGERIEINGPAGMDLTGWSVVLYNGSNGQTYDSDAFSGSIPASCGDRGVAVIAYPTNGIQNGSPDAIALVHNGTVVEFLSYEGAFRATNGPANGLLSVDVGASQGSSTPLDASIQRRDDGSWLATDVNTFAACNAGGGPTEPPPPELPAVRIVEVHYDNVGVDVGEAIEIEGPAGTNLDGWKVVLYNGSNATMYASRALGGVLADRCGGRDVAVLRFEQDGIQNGGADGIALVDAEGVVVEFLSYEGTLTAADGPAAGLASLDIGARQSSAPHFLTLQRSPEGVWSPLPSTLGGCFGGTPVTPVNQLSFSGRSPFDVPLPVGFEDQLFGDLRAPDNSEVATTIVWQSVTPSIATIDADGVFRALAPGTATFRGTAADGTTATYSLPTAIATASTTAQYGNHTEFGLPTDGDASDDFVLRRVEFTSSFNRGRNIPNWVSYNLDATHITGEQDRCDCFTYDPELPADFARYTTADYTGAGAVAGFGIDRGHLARSFDRTSGALDNARTFYFSNIIPQAADNNQGPWSDMETAVGDRARLEDREVYIIAGASGSKGTVKNEGLITIPTHVWKVVVVMPRDQGLAHVDSPGDVEIIAAIIPNEPGIRDHDWRNYLTTVNAVEALSGYDVLDLLADDIERIVEAGMQEELAIIDALAANGKISAGIANSLRSKLDAAAAALDRGNDTAARSQLGALVNEIDALTRSRRLDAVDAAALETAIAALTESLGSTAPTRKNPD